MSRIMSAAMAAGCLLALTACGEDEEKQETVEQDASMPGLECNSVNTRGVVSLNITGKPGDSYRIIMTCGRQEVTRCTATIPAGGNKATCTNQGPVPNGGVRNCPVGPGNNNSVAARVVASGCG